MTDESKWTKEPWVLARGHDRLGNPVTEIYQKGDGIVDSIGRPHVASIPVNYVEDIPEAEANAARIVACVNGCKGIAHPEAVAEVVKALRFYANPETYAAIGFFPDRPCGEFIDDFNDTGPVFGVKPGVRARAAVAALDAHPKHVMNRPCPVCNPAEAEAEPVGAKVPDGLAAPQGSGSVVDDDGRRYGPVAS